MDTTPVSPITRTPPSPRPEHAPRAARAYTPLEAAVLRTTIYADVFHFALTRAELCHFLIAAQPYSAAQIAQALREPPLQAALCMDGEYLALSGREALFALRAEREAMAAELWRSARQCSMWLARLPYVRMVALTGALAMHNPASPHDDLDYLLVTAEGRVWTARALAVLLVKVGRVFGVTICPNYVVAESALAQSRRDLFIAHELCQMIPLFGHPLYAVMRAQNSWTVAQMPNAAAPFYAEADTAPRGLWAAAKRGGEWLLGGALGSAFERWEYRRKQRRFAAQMSAQTAAPAAIVDAQQVKGHFNDHGHPVIIHYETRLREYGLSAQP